MIAGMARDSEGWMLRDRGRPPMLSAGAGGPCEGALEEAAPGRRA